MITDSVARSEQFWDAAARSDACWYVATGVPADEESFAASGRAETDMFLAHCGMAPSRDSTVLEIGCGVGRMTQRLAELYGSVTAVDISAEMLDRARERLTQYSNIRWVHGNGRDLHFADDSSVDAVFSYIVLQHIPTAEGQLAYLRESSRVLAPGGVGALQIRANTPTARAIDWAGHMVHRLQGRRTLDRPWRGARVSRASVLAAAAGAELHPYGLRHTWVVIRRPG